MSYNVDHVECLFGELTISEEGKRWLNRFDEPDEDEEDEDEEDEDEEGEDEEDEDEEDEDEEDEDEEDEDEEDEDEEDDDKWWPELPPEVERTADGRDVVRMYWSGECSGHAVTYGGLAKFFSFTRGTAEFVFYWEGGESMTGYRVVDGVMTEHEVEVKLGPSVKSSS